MSDVVIYLPSQCIRWLEMGAGDLKEGAREKARQAKEEFQERNIGHAVRQTFTAAVDAARAYIADLAGKRGEAIEFRLYEDHAELVTLLRTIAVEYAKVKSVVRIEGTKYRFKVVTEQGDHAISPVAWISAGTVKVPIGWERNGIEVPYDLLIEEFAARCNLKITE